MTASPLASAAESLATAASQMFDDAQPLVLVTIFPNGGYAAAYLGEPSSEQYTEAAIAFGELAQEARQKADA